MSRLGMENKNTIKSCEKPTIKDIYWAAGIYEGEGNASYNTYKGNVYARACVGQKDPWLILRLQRMFGGSVKKNASLEKRGITCFTWFVSGARARGFLLTIYPLLSPRRKEQVRKAIFS